MNYQLLLDKELENIVSSNKTPKLLLHSCCAPCSSYVIEYLSEYFEITIFYYNPNIYPYEEYMKRVEEQKEFIKKISTKNKINFIEGIYDNNRYNEIVKGLENEKEGSNRCFKCYRMRLEETIKMAKELNYDYFTTTLSISPYKNSNKLNEIGIELEQEYNVKYLYADFKKKNGYKRSIELSKIYNLYRQDYCGCIHSLNNKRTV